jgi:hypothetical protein
MSRPVVDFERVSVEDLANAAHTEPVRFVLPNPRRGGPALGALRAALASKGRVRISATTLRTFVDFDPGAAEPALVALDTIVRNDAEGLERMLISVLPHVDEVVLAVDGRSDEATRKVAEAYADTVVVFEANDIGMSLVDWNPTETNPRDKIDFAAARNLGRSRVHSPWTLVLDSDEYLGDAEDLRAKVSQATAVIDGFRIRVRAGTFEHPDPQRLARTKYRWTSSVHNQLLYPYEPVPADERTHIVCDTSLRDAEEQARRNAQRNVNIEDLVEEAAHGNLSALFHLAKHRAGQEDIAEAVRLVEDYRLRIEPHCPLSDERTWVALMLAFRYYNEDNLVEADRWAVRALLDGPSLTAFCLLGDVAEGQGDLVRAKGWYEAACALSERRPVEWPGFTELRFGRLAGIKLALANPRGAAQIAVGEETEATPNAEEGTSTSRPSP